MGGDPPERRARVGVSGPPRLGQAIVRALLPPEWRDSVAGDLEEGWAKRRERGASPHLWYWSQLISLRPGRMSASGGGRGDPHRSLGGKGGPTGGSLTRSVMVAARALGHDPVFAALSVTTLALGIAGATLLFTLADTLFFRRMSIEDPESLYAVLNTHSAGDGTVQEYSVSPLDVLRWEEEGQFTDLGALLGATMTLETAEGTEVIQGARASSGFFAVLGLDAETGRVFSEEEDRVGAPVVVLSWGLWQTLFRGQPLPRGATLVLDGEAHDVIGVMPRGFARELGEWSLWVPLNLTRATLAGPQSRFLSVFGRSQRDLDELNGQLRRIGALLSEESPESHEGWSAVARPLRETLAEDERSGVIVLLCGGLVLFLLACSNVANLVVSRAVRRRPEIALRQALGGSLWQAWEATLAECLMVGLLGAIGGIALVGLTLQPLVSLNPSSSLLLASARLDGRSVAFGLALGGVATAVVLAIARLANRGVAAEGVRQASRAALSTRVQRGWRKALVGGQVALSVVLVSTAAGLVATMREIASRDLGFEPDGLLAVQFTLSLREYPDHAARARTHAVILDNIRTVPGVRSAALTTNRFLRDASVTTTIWIEDHPEGPETTFTPDFRRISEGYFGTAGIEILKGRPIDGDDQADAPPVAVVSRAMAAAYWPGQEVIGKRVQRTGGIHPWLTIVGVADDALDAGAAAAARPTLYIPYAQNSSPAVNVVVRAAESSPDLVDRLRGAVRAVDQGIAIEGVSSVPDLMDRALAVERFRLLMMTLMGGAGLVMAVVGLYGITAQSVMDRTGELGLRAALGATPSGAVTLILRDSAIVVVVGALGGVAATAMLGSLVARLLPDLSVVTWPTLLAGTALLGSTAIVAALLAALGATRSHPMDALRG